MSRRRRRGLVAVLLVAGPSVASASGCAAPAARPPVEPGADLLQAVDWYTGVAGRVDDDRARELLERAAGLADASVASDAPANALAVMWLARVHSRGRMGFARDEEKARRLAGEVIDAVEASALAGVLEAVFLMGTAYDEGLGKPVDPAYAARWHQRAAERGHVLGAHNLGNAYSEGRGVPLDPAQAVAWWTRAADKGDAITQLRLGEASEAGRGTPRDLKAAVDWYRRAAEAGNAQAAEALERLGG